MIQKSICKLHISEEELKLNIIDETTNKEREIELEFVRLENFYSNYSGICNLYLVEKTGLTKEEEGFIFLAEEDRFVFPYEMFELYKNSNITEQQYGFNKQSSRGIQEFHKFKIRFEPHFDVGNINQVQTISIPLTQIITIDPSFVTPGDTITINGTQFQLRTTYDLNNSNNVIVLSYVDSNGQRVEISGNNIFISEEIDTIIPLEGNIVTISTTHHQYHESDEEINRKYNQYLYEGLNYNYHLQIDEQLEVADSYLNAFNKILENCFYLSRDSP